MKFLIVCGGSAGHINPAVAIAERLRIKLPQAVILFAGAGKILENRLIPAAGFDLVNIKMSGVRRGISPKDVIHNIKTIKNLMFAGIKSKKLLIEFKPDAVIGTGGYVCYPVIKKAAKLKIPTFLLEPNALPGLAVRMLSSVTDKIFITYPGSEEKYKFPERVIYSGTPLRTEFSDKVEGLNTRPENNKTENDKPLVISYWGSLGAPNMNDLIAGFIKINTEKQKFDHIHATGIGSSAEEMIDRLKKSGVKNIKPPIADIRGYIDDMFTVMNGSTVVIARAGASTIAELAALGKPAVLIPSPNVTENHQEENAKQIQNAGGAIMMLEKDCTAEKLYETISSLLDDPKKLSLMESVQKRLSVSGAAEKIADTVLEYCKYNCKNDLKAGEIRNGKEQ